MIILVDFGSQTAHLISRRIKELGADVKIVQPEEILKQVQDDFNIKGIILSGGPASVYEAGAPTIDPQIFKLGIPILGICYGQQLMCHLLGGKVRAGFKKEYGPAILSIKSQAPNFKLLDGLPAKLNVWMSHGDEVVDIPKDFVSIGRTENIPHAIIADEKNKIYGIQFHPEVVHTQYGHDFLRNFLDICEVEIKKHEIDKSFVGNLIEDVKESISDKKAICALSGGVDSSVAAVLVHKAIGKKLTSVYIDSGLMRTDETKILREVFDKHFKMNVKIINAKEFFLKNLKGVIDPEEKRKAIGKTFIDVFESVAKDLGAEVLVQGTIYPDVIESKGSKYAQNIKSHHNVGGLPENMNLILVEPLRQFYKDEVRRIGSLIGLPEIVVRRQPFPGPGLAVRIIGEVTDEKIDILRRSDKIVSEEIEKNKLDKKLWQFFAVFTGIKTTGVRGDARFYGETIAIRALEAEDAMSANFAKLPYEVLEKISLRIVTEVPEVNRIVYDITNKPPATMEWE